jgi:hypothetical protein
MLYCTEIGLHFLELDNKVKIVIFHLGRFQVSSAIFWF